MCLCYSLCFDLPSVRTQQHENPLTDIDEIWYEKVLQQTVDLYLHCLKSNRSSRHFTWTSNCIPADISYLTGQIMYRHKCCTETLWRKIELFSELCFCNYLDSQSNLARRKEGATIFRQSMHFQIFFVTL